MFAMGQRVELGVLGMVDKKEDKKEKDPFSDSSEIFESIFKEASQEIQSETEKVAPKAGLKPKPKPGIKPKPEAKPKAPTKLEIEPKAPTKLELEPKEEPEPIKDLSQDRPPSEQKPRLQAPAFKPRQEPVRRPITRTARPEEETTRSDMVSTQPLARTSIQGQTAKEESGGKLKKPKLPKRKGKGSPLLKIILLIVLLAIGVGGASVYLGILDLSDYIGWPEPAKKETPKVVAAKPAKPVTPNAAQPSTPQAKPAEAPKPPVQPPPAQAKPAELPKPPVQPSQVPPKAAETVTPPQPPPPPSTPAVTPPKPPEVQAKEEPPAPPAVAKVEKPLPPAQPPVKAEPLPSPVQPPVKSEPQAPPPSAQPPVKSQPKTPPAPVQQPVVPKSAETPQAGVQPKEVAAAKTVPHVSAGTVAYPYSVYLGSVQSMDYAIKGLSSYESQGFSTYWSKVHLGAKGTWYRLFTGYFRSAQEAEAFIRQKGIKDGEVKETRYSNLVGTFATKKEGEEKALAFTKMGLSAYCIPAADGQFRLYSGAFITRDGAENNQAELNSKGIKSQIAER